MSRNFELLQRIEQEHGICTEHRQSTIADTCCMHTASTDSNMHTAPSYTKRLSLGMDPIAREEVIKLVQHLFIFPAARKRVVVFSAAERGNGCSWVTAYAAELLAAQVSAQVCVVDASFRSPALHGYFNVQNNLGLTDAVLHPGPIKPYVQQLSSDNLWILTSGSLSAADQELLTADRFRSLMLELHAHFDYILVDAPPLTFYSDAIALGHVADGVALVVQEHSTKRQLASKAVQDLCKANVPLLGVVLNKRTFPIPPQIYSKLHS